jgi:hypothetical protein
MKENKEKEIIYFVTRVIIVVGRKSLRLVFFSLFFNPNGMGDGIYTVSHPTTIDLASHSIPCWKKSKSPNLLFRSQQTTF